MSCLKHVNQDYTKPGVTHTLIKYVYSHAHASGGLAVDPNHAAEQMERYRKIWGKPDGQQVVHYVYALSEEESARIVSTGRIIQLAYAICTYFADSYQIIFGVHRDERWHIHFVMNSVSYVDGRRYPGRESDDQRLAAYIHALTGYWVELIYH